MLKSIIKTDQTTSSTDPLLNSVIPSTSSASTSTTTAIATAAIATAAPMKKDTLDDPFTMLGTNSLAGTSYDPNQHDDDNHRSISRQSSAGNLQGMAQSVAGSQLYPPLAQVLSFDRLIVNSSLSDDDNDKQQQQILAAFNQHKGKALDPKNFISVGGIRGARVDRGKFKIFHRNNVPFLVAPTDKLVATASIMTTVDRNEEVGVYSQSAPYFSAHGVHVINVPPGEIARITDGKTRKFLGEGPHVIHSETLIPLTEKDFIKISQPFIQHGNLHILRIPIGFIAKVNINNKPELLEGREEPYIYNNATFELVKKSASEIYHSATDRIIEHGTIKRLLPKDGEVAVTYKGGVLSILKPNEQGQPIILNDANHSVSKDPFLQVNTNTVTFPKDGEYAHGTTKEGIQVRMKMMLTYQIGDAGIAVKSLGFGKLSAHDAILEHIEKCAMTDMRRATQNNNYYEAQETSRNHANASSSSSSTSSAPPFFNNVLDEIRDNLGKELLEKGIKLERLYFSEFDCTDQKVQSSMAINAQKTQDTYTQVALLQQQSQLDRETAQRQVLVSRIQKEGELERARIDAQQQLVIAEGKANQDASVIRIQQEQANKNILLKAQTELDAAKIRAEALLVTAKAEAEAVRMKGEAESSMQKLLATVVLDNPAYLQLLIAEKQAKALAGVHGMVVSADVARSVYAVGTPAFFTPPAPGVEQVALGQGMQMPQAQQPK